MYVAPELEDKVAAFSRIKVDGLVETLGIEYLHFAPNLFSARMPVDGRTYQPGGLLHGGASVALAETLASVGTALLVDETRYTAVGMEVNANHLRPVKTGHVTAEARPVHKGRSSFVWSIEVKDDAGRMVCVSRCTVAVVALRNGKGDLT